MIWLGHLSVTDSDGAVAARKKIRQFVDHIGFSNILATRLETIVYEICRVGCRGGKKMHIEVELASEDSRSALVLTFQSAERIEEITAVDRFFDDYNVKKSEDGANRLSARISLPESNQRLSVEDIEELRTVLASPSRNELMRILKEKNDELEANTLEMSKLSQAVTHSPVSIVITDKNGRIEYINPKFVEITGYSADEVLGQNPRVLKSGVHSSAFYDAMWKTILSGQQWHGELCNLRKDGRLFWESTSISPVLNADGEVKYFVAVKEDITERKEMDKEIQDRVEELSKSRRAMLNIMEDLGEEKQKAEAATQAKSDFLANMSHEIRTPMNAILGMTHLALKTELNPKQRDYIQKTHTSAQSLLGIINDILDFSKIEAGKLNMEVIDFDLSEVLENLSNLVTIKTQEKGLEFVFAVSPGTPTSLRGDPLRLGQILLNLSGNAVKFTEAGEIVVSVEPVAVSEAHTVLKFSVRDTGIGLTEAQRSKLFQSFQQADSSTTRKYGGTGLGLTISKKLTEMMGGEIGVTSESGKGTTFFFTARFGRHEDTKTRHTVIPEVLNNLKALVVDDNATFREVLKVYLEEFTFEVHTAPSGKQSLESIRRALKRGEKPFDLVFMDWQMPEMSGIETARILINDPDIGHRPKIIMVTGHGRADVINDAGDLELDGLLLKPVTQSQLMDATVAAFGMAGGRNVMGGQRKEKRPDGFDAARGARILLVEDNEINQQVATELLEAEGFFISVAGNGKIAVDAVVASVEKGAYDVVLMDLQMPVMDGYTAAREIRKDSRFAGLPIIAMTADAMAGVREEVISCGMNDYVTKPINPAALFEALTRWVAPGQRELPAGYAEEKTADAPSPAVDRLPDLPGIDTDAGIKRVAGNRALYTKLLVKFYDGYETTAADIQKALEDGDQELSVRLAHTVKGVAGNIGAGDLQGVAAELEHALKQGHSEGVPELLQRFGQAIAATRTVLAPVAAAAAARIETVAGDAVVQDPAALAALLAELQPFVSKRKPKPSKDVMARIAALAWPPPFDADIRNLESMIGKYKFKEAADSVEALMAKL